MGLLAAFEFGLCDALDAKEPVEPKACDRWSKHREREHRVRFEREERRRMKKKARAFSGTPF